MVDIQPVSPPSKSVDLLYSVLHPTTEQKSIVTSSEPTASPIWMRQPWTGISRDNPRGSDPDVQTDRLLPPRPPGDLVGTASAIGP